MILVPIFSALILAYREMLAEVLYRLFPARKRESIHEILVETIVAYYNFVKGMLLVYLIVGLLNSLGLWIIGVPRPFLLGFIASILTFIPYVGILVASLPPIFISWVTYNSILYPFYVILVFTFVQLLEAYLIFPFAVGGSLKINTLVIMVVILVGGMLWGGAGMILFIPFVSILKLIADRTEGLETLAILLGEGKTKNKEGT
jgi:predicted PurR-regulated permease PerM